MVMNVPPEQREYWVHAFHPDVLGPFQNPGCFETPVAVAKYVIWPFQNLIWFQNGLAISKPNWPETELDICQ